MTELRAETVADERGLESLGRSWDELVRSMARPSPFLLHGWLVEWWRHYGAGGRLSVGVLRDDNGVRGALPLCVRRRWGLRMIEFLGGSKAALADLMLSPDVESSAAAKLAEQALAIEYDYADLFGLPAGSRLAATVPAGSLRLIERIEAPVLDLAAGWETVYHQKLSSKARANRRRRQRRLETHGAVDISVARSARDLDADLGEAFRVHQRRWHGRRDTSGFASLTGQRFHRAALARLAKQDVPRLVTLRLRGWAIAFALYLQLEDTVYGLNMAFDPAFARFAPGAEAMLCALETAATEGIQRVEFLGTAADHKARLTDRLEPIYEGIGLAATIRGHAAVEALTRSIRVRRQLKRSQTAHKLYYRVPRLSRS
jgi:CelD/BcsL family acetyltransferase involved in cellulose biosynthesis